MESGQQSLKASELILACDAFLKKGHQPSAVIVELGTVLATIRQHYSSSPGDVLSDADSLLLLQALASGFQIDRQTIRNLDLGRSTYRFASGLVVRLLQISQWTANGRRGNSSVTLNSPEQLQKMYMDNRSLIESASDLKRTHFLRSLELLLEKNRLNGSFIQTVRGKIQIVLSRQHLCLAAELGDLAFPLCFTEEFRNGVATPDRWDTQYSFVALKDLWKFIQAKRLDFKKIDRSAWSAKLAEISKDPALENPVYGTKGSRFVQQQVEKNYLLLEAMIEDALAMPFLEEQLKEQWFSQFQEVCAVYKGGHSHPVTQAISRAVSHAKERVTDQNVSLEDIKAQAFVEVIAGIPDSNEKNWSRKTLRILGVGVIGFLLEMLAFTVEGVVDVPRLFKLLEPKEKIADHEKFWGSLRFLYSHVFQQRTPGFWGSWHKSILQGIPKFHWLLWLEALAQLAEQNPKRSQVLFLDSVKSFTQGEKVPEEFYEVVPLLSSLVRDDEQFGKIFQNLVNFLNTLPEAPGVRYVLKELKASHEKIDLRNIEECGQHLQAAYETELSTVVLWQKFGLPVGDPRAFKLGQTDFSLVDELCEAFFAHPHHGTALVDGEFSTVWLQLRKKYSPGDRLMQGDELLMLRALALDIQVDCSKEKNIIDPGRETYRFVLALVSLLLNITQKVQVERFLAPLMTLNYSASQLQREVVGWMKQSEFVKGVSRHPLRFYVEQEGVFLLSALPRLLNEGHLNLDFMETVSGKLAIEKPFRHLLLAGGLGEKAFQLCFGPELKSSLCGEFDFFILERVWGLIKNNHETFKALTVPEGEGLLKLKELMENSPFFSSVDWEFHARQFSKQILSLIFPLVEKIQDKPLRENIARKISGNAEFFEAMIADVMGMPVVHGVTFVLPTPFFSQEKNTTTAQNKQATSPRSANPQDWQYLDEKEDKTFDL